MRCENFVSNVSLSFATGLSGLQTFKDGLIATSAVWRNRLIVISGAVLVIGVSVILIKYFAVWFYGSQRVGSPEKKSPTAKPSELQHVDAAQIHEYLNKVQETGGSVVIGKEGVTVTSEISFDD